MESYNKRIHLIDEVRGLCVFCMVVFHALYTAFYIFDFTFAKKWIELFTPAEPFFAGVFIFISGICVQLSKNAFRRGLILLATAMGLTGVMVLATLIDIHEPIWFGVLHLLAVSMLLFAALRKFIDKCPPFFMAILMAVLFLIAYRIELGYLLLFQKVQLPEQWYSTSFLFPIGLVNYQLRFSDYFPIFPWTFLFFTGVFTGAYAKRGRFPEFMYKSRIKGLSFIGRYALLIYLLHQPCIYLLFLLIGKVV